MGVPELDRLGVGIAVEGDAGTTFRLPERVPHHGDGRHRGLAGVELAVDGDDAPFGARNVALRDRLLLVFLLELLVGVEDEVEPLGARRLETTEPAGEHRQLALAPCLVAGAEEVGVLGGDGGDARLGLAGVLDEEMLAERGVPRNKHSTGEHHLALRQLHQTVGGEPDDAGAGEGWVEVTAEGELGDSDATHVDSGGEK